MYIALNSYSLHSNIWKTHATFKEINAKSACGCRNLREHVWYSVFRHYQSPGQVFSFYWHWGPDHSLLQGIVLCTVECLTASTASTHQMPIETSPLLPLPYLPQVWRPKDVSRYCQMSPGESTKSSQMRIENLCSKISRNQFFEIFPIHLHYLLYYSLIVSLWNLISC